MPVFVVHCLFFYTNKLVKTIVISYKVQQIGKRMVFYQGLVFKPVTDVQTLLIHLFITYFKIFSKLNRGRQYIVKLALLPTFVNNTIRFLFKVEGLLRVLFEVLGVYR